MIHTYYIVCNFFIIDIMLKFIDMLQELITPELKSMELPMIFHPSYSTWHGIQLKIHLPVLRETACTCTMHEELLQKKVFHCNLFGIAHDQAVHMLMVESLSSKAYDITTTRFSNKCKIKAVACRDS